VISPRRSFGRVGSLRKISTFAGAPGRARSPSTSRRSKPSRPMSRSWSSPGTRPGARR
jgi:hypothetical protein